MNGFLHFLVIFGYLILGVLITAPVLFMNTLIFHKMFESLKKHCYGRFFLLILLFLASVVVVVCTFTLTPIHRLSSREFCVSSCACLLFLTIIDFILFFLHYLLQLCEISIFKKFFNLLEKRYYFTLFLSILIFTFSINVIIDTILYFLLLYAFTH